MGCDGGTIPKRKEIVKNKQRRPRQERDKGAGAAEQWQNCAICDWILKKPIVAGHWGHIFCKECVLQHLIDYKQKETLMSYDLVADKSPILDSLHSTKDIKALKLKENPDKDHASTSEEELLRPDFVCPITGLETNGKYKFVFSWNCGCVVSERAVKEVPNEEKCLVCQTPYKPFELVTINPDKKDLEENQCKFLARKMHAILEKERSDSSFSSDSSGWGYNEQASTSRSSSSSYEQLRRKRQQRRGNSGSSNQDGASTSSCPQSESSDNHQGNRRNHDDEASTSTSSTSQSKRQKS
uniref:Replication termination factor 2 n=1 Tax=Aceria tosichella TaxID=561515 RepID=A0A6G1SBZ3_9ACAR